MISTNLNKYLKEMLTYILFVSERVNDVDGVEPVPCQPWTSRLSKMAQPNLDYTGE